VSKLIIIKGEGKMLEDIKKLVFDSPLKGFDSEKLELVDKLDDYFLNRLNKLEYELAYQVELVGLNDSLDASSPKNARPVTQPSLFIDREAFNSLFVNMDKSDREKLRNTLQD
jgi:hypothetical protein